MTEQDTENKNPENSESKPAKLPLRVLDLKVLSWIEQYWYKKDSFPPVGLLRDNWPDFDLKAALKNEVFMRSLYNRGISPPQPEDTGLDEAQMAAILAISDFRDKRSFQAKLNNMGVSITQWNGWMRETKFRSFFQELCGTNFQDALDVVQRGILGAVEKGNVEASKFYLEITGRYTPQTQELGNVKLVLSKILEVIRIHVKDDDTLRKIATDFEVVLQGGEPTVPKEITI